MDFSYTDVQQMLQDSVQKFVQKSYDFDTRNTILNSDEGFSDENWQLFAELGWLAVPFSEEDGGLGLHDDTRGELGPPGLANDNRARRLDDLAGAAASHVL